MFIELNYPDSLGSGCPFCGHPLSSRLSEWGENHWYPHPNKDIKTYKCQCKNNHFAFIKTVSEDRRDGYYFRKYVYVLFEDWCEHVGRYSKHWYNKYTNFINPSILNEELLWHNSRIMAMPLKAPKTK